nr:AI-2E family transporter [Flavimaribacter sediminis]
MTQTGAYSEKTSEQSEPAIRGFAARSAIFVALASLAFLFWYLRQTLVVAYVSVVIAVILVAGADALRRVLPIDRRWRILATCTLIVLGLFLFGLFLWPQLSLQYDYLVDQLAEALDKLEQTTGFSVDGTLGLDNASGPLPDILGKVIPMAGTLLSILTGTVLVLLAGTFLALDPPLYRDGLVKIFPSRLHGEIRDAFDRTGKGLKMWLVGKLVSMAIVGVLTGLGVWIIGLPSPLALGAVAFLTAFVPLIGPLFGAVPALVLALADDGQTLLWTILVYMAVQMVESNLITPLIQRRAVNVPPALFMLSVLCMGSLFGAMGVVLAGPLTVTLFILARALYIERKLDVSDGKKSSA